MTSRAILCSITVLWLTAAVQTMAAPPDRDLPVGPSDRGGRRSTAGVGRRAAEAATPSIEVDPLIVKLGSVDLGGTLERRSALTVRVFSERPWTLILSPMGGIVPTDAARLEWRTAASGNWIQLAGSVVAARGEATSAAGDLAVIDLRLVTGTEDLSGSIDVQIDLTLKEN